jgi:hypothetical protein
VAGAASKRGGAEIAKYRAYWKLGTVQRLVLEIPLDLSARRTDTTRLGPGHRLDGDVIEFMHNKNGVEVTIPMSPRLLAAIEAMPATNRILLPFCYPTADDWTGRCSTAWSHDVRKAQ